MTPRDFAAMLALTSAIHGCARHEAPTRTTWLVIDAADDIDLAGARVQGSGVRSATSSGSTLTVEIDASRTTGVEVDAGGACPLRFSRDEALAGGVNRRAAASWLGIDGAGPRIGYGAPLEIRVRPGCPEAAKGHIAWTEKRGLPLRDIRTGDNGYRFSATLPTLAEALGEAPPWGIVPISPRTRGDVELEATWTGGSQRVVRTVHASAAARSHGLPNVTVGARLYFGGEGWHVVSAPPLSHAAVEWTGGAASLEPDMRGAFTLEDAHGTTLRLAAGKYDETPLDCGRSDCHASVAVSARSNPMMSILQRGLDAPFGGDYPACATGCHAVGEPGLDDGGFAAVASDLGRRPTDLAHANWHDLPASLQRLGGVGCLACHGPGSVAEANSHFAILRADVCATCHDAPPEYGHVVAWRASRMSRSDAAPETRSGACAQCHTTWGFLGANDRRPPPEIGAIGISCAACHAVHPTGARAGAEPVVGRTCAEALRRDVPVPAILDGAVPRRAERSRVCLSCHSPRLEDGMPSATAAALWLARGGIDPSTGAAIPGPAPHADVEGGCVGCHRSGPDGLQRGTGHAFLARRDACAACHANKPASSLTARAGDLWKRIGTKVATGVVTHVTHAEGLRPDLGTPLGRAAWDVAMVLEDPAADAHNAPYARALLDAAERTLAAARPATKSGATSGGPR